MSIESDPSSRSSPNQPPIPPEVNLGYMASPPDGLSLVLYDPGIVTRTSPKAMGQYFTELIPENIPKHIPIGAKGHDELGVKARLQSREVSPGTIVHEHQNLGTSVELMRSAVRDHYMGKVVDIVLARRKSTPDSITRVESSNPLENAKNEGPAVSQHKPSMHEKTNADLPDIINDDGQAIAQVNPDLDIDVTENREIDQGEASILRTIYRGILRFRRERAQRTIDSLESRQRAIRETTDAVINSMPPPTGARPVSGRELRAAERASRRKRSAGKYYLDKRHYAQSFGAGEIPNEGGAWTRAPFFLPWETVDPQQDARVTDLDTPAQEERLNSGRYMPFETRAERRAARRMRRARSRHYRKIEANVAQ